MLLKICTIVIDIDDCKPDSCSVNGKCVDLINAVRCDCNTGFTGQKCETSKLYGFTVEKYETSNKYSFFLNST